VLHNYLCDGGYCKIGLMQVVGVMFVLILLPNYTVSVTTYLNSTVLLSVCPVGCS
jgi:hypothetical protein